MEGAMETDEPGQSVVQIVGRMDGMRAPEPVCVTFGSVQVMCDALCECAPQLACAEVHGLHGVVLGQGGFATVLAGFWPERGCKVAIKVTTASDGANELKLAVSGGRHGQALRTARLEAFADLLFAARGQHEGQEVLAQGFALMDGTLFDVLQQIDSGRMATSSPAIFIANVAVELPRLLQSLVGKGLLAHCDIKPDNIAFKLTRGGRGGCTLKLIDLGLGKELRPREGTPEVARNNRTLQHLLDYFGHSVDGAFGSKTTVAPEMLLSKHIGPLFDQFGASYAMLIMLYGPALMYAPMPGVQLGRLLRKQFVEYYSTGAVGHRHLLGSWARTKLRLPPLTSDVYIFTLAMGLSADPRLRPWYSEQQHVAIPFQWSAGVRDAVLDANQPASRYSDILLPGFDALYALSAVRALLPLVPNMSKEERLAVRQLADAAVRVFDGGFSNMCGVLGAGCGPAHQVEPDLPASPTKRRRMGDGGSAASPTSALVIPLGFEPGLEEQHLCMLSSCSELVELVPTLPHNPACGETDTIDVLLRELEAALEVKEMQKDSPYVLQHLEAPLRSERNFWPSSTSAEVNIQAIDSLKNVWLDTDKMVHGFITGSLDLLKTSGHGGCLPSDVLVGPFFESSVSVLTLVLGVGHQLEMPDSSQDVAQAECTMHAHDMLQCLPPEVQRVVLEVVLDPDTSLLRKCIASSKLDQSKKASTVRAKSLRSLWRKSRRLFGGKASDPVTELSAPMKTRADVQALVLLLAACHSQYAHLLRMEADQQMSVHQLVLDQLRRSCEVALVMDPTLSAPRLAALLTFAADKAQQLFQELPPLRRGGRPLPFSASQHRTAQAGLPQRGDDAAQHAATVGQAARASSASRPLTTTAKIRRTAATLLLAKLEGDSCELMMENFECASTCKAMCAELTGSADGGSLLPASRGLRSWGELLPTTRSYLRMLLAVAQPGGGTMRAALRYLCSQPAPATPEQLQHDGLPAGATAAQYAAYLLMGQQQLVSLCHATEAASGAAALEEFMGWVESMLEQVHCQASPTGLLTPATSISSISSGSEDGGTRCVSTPTKANRQDALLVQLNQAFKLEAPGLAVPYEFRGRVGVPPAIAACPGWLRYERLVCCYPRRHSVLAAQAREQQPDARLLDPTDAAPLELAADAFDGVLHMQNGTGARVLGIAVRFQVARQLQLHLGRPLDIETTDHQAAQVARAAGAGSPAAAAAAGVPWLPGLAEVTIQAMGQAGSGVPVRGWHQFGNAACASQDQLMLCQGDLLHLARRLTESGHSAGGCWQQMLHRLESGGLQALDEHISVSFVEQQGLAAALEQLHVC